MSEATIQCSRCGRQAGVLSGVPYGGQLGQQILANTCEDCWEEWLKAEVMVINELRLNFMDPKSQDILAKHLRDFLLLPAAQT